MLLHPRRALVRQVFVYPTYVGVEEVPVRFRRGDFTPTSSEHDIVRESVRHRRREAYWPGRSLGPLGGSGQLAARSLSPRGGYRVVHITAERALGARGAPRLALDRLRHPRAD